MAAAIPQIGKICIRESGRILGVRCFPREDIRPALILPDGPKAPPFPKVPRVSKAAKNLKTLSLRESFPCPFLTLSR